MFEYRFIDYVYAPFLWALFSVDWFWRIVGTAIELCSLVVVSTIAVAVAPVAFFIWVVHNVDKFFRPSTHKKYTWSLANLALMFAPEHGGDCRNEARKSED